MSLNTNRAFTIALTVATLIYIAQKMSVPLPALVNNYMNDILCMPIVLHSCQLVLSYIKSNKGIFAPIQIKITLTIIFGIYFELILPLYNIRYTSDWVDVVMYFSGMLLYNYVESQDRNKTAFVH